MIVCLVYYHLRSQPNNISAKILKFGSPRYVYTYGGGGAPASAADVAAERRRQHATPNLFNLLTPSQQRSQHPARPDCGSVPRQGCMWRVRDSSHVVCCL